MLCGMVWSFVSFLTVAILAQAPLGLTLSLVFWESRRYPPHKHSMRLVLFFFRMAAVGGAAAPQVEAAGGAAPDQPVEGVPAPPTPLNISPNPTADEFQVWVDSGLTISPIADWAKLSGDKLNALLEMFDVEATDHVRFIAVISKKDYDDAVSGITLNGRPVGIGFKSKA